MSTATSAAAGWSSPARPARLHATRRFCEIDGYDFVEDRPGADPRPDPSDAGHGGDRDPGWEAVAVADRAYYDEVIAQDGPDAARIAFPPYCPKRSFPLAGTQMRIGRQSHLWNLHPEIDLTGPPEDPGVSHLHAVLIARPGGSWTLVDPGSANGTRVNGKPVQTNVPVALGDGDRIHLGAWTVLLVRARTRHGGDPDTAPDSGPNAGTPCHDCGARRLPDVMATASRRKEPFQAGSAPYPASAWPR